MSVRKIKHKVRAIDAKDGDGVKIRRIGGAMMQTYLNPFLMIDEIRSDDASDYIGGFPSHPHRGFETISYMKVGRMRHRDHMGNEGVVGPGDVQWMTAGRGVIHSEMPEQDQGLLHGFQLWLNLPAAEKMKPAAYQDFDADRIPTMVVNGREKLRAIAGVVDVEFGSESINLKGALPQISTRPVMLDIALHKGESIALKFAAEQKAVVYVYDGASDELKSGEAAFYDPGEVLSLSAYSETFRALVLSGAEINEPIAQYGPFVMNTHAELEQAIDDYRTGRLVT